MKYPEYIKVIKQIYSGGGVRSSDTSKMPNLFMASLLGMGLYRLSHTMKGDRDRDLLIYNCLQECDNGGLSIFKEELDELKNVEKALVIYHMSSAELQLLSILSIIRQR